MIAQEDLDDWRKDCEKYGGVGFILTGKFAHWCWEWDGLPIDETVPEFRCCPCYTDEEKNREQVSSV